MSSCIGHWSLDTTAAFRGRDAGQPYADGGINYVYLVFSVKGRTEIALTVLEADPNVPNVRIVEDIARRLVSRISTRVVIARA